MMIGLNAVALMAATGILCAQTGTFKGAAVHGSAASPIGNAGVVATNLKTKLKTDQATTDMDGSFTLKDLAYGKHKFSVTVGNLPIEFEGPFVLNAAVRSVMLEVTDGKGSVVPLAPPFPQIHGGQVKFANNSTAAMTFTAFGLFILSLKDPAIAPGDYTTLSLEFRAFTFGGKSPQEELNISAEPQRPAHLKDQALHTPPLVAKGDRTWTWQLTADESFTGSDVGVSIIVKHKPRKGEPEETPPVTPKLTLGKVAKPKFFTEYKDVIGPVAAAVVTGVCTFFAGRQSGNRQGAAATAQTARVEASLTPPPGTNAETPAAEADQQPSPPPRQES
jgi:hypothetical protein